MCEGPGAGMLAWPECREGGTVRQPRGDDLCLKGEVGSLPLHLFLLHFSSLSVYFCESHYGLASFKCI